MKLPILSIPRLLVVHNVNPAMSTLNSTSLRLGAGSLVKRGFITNNTSIPRNNNKNQLQNRNISRIPTGYTDLFKSFLIEPSSFSLRTLINSKSYSYSYSHSYSSNSYRSSSSSFSLRYLLASTALIAPLALENDKTESNPQPPMDSDTPSSPTSTSSSSPLNKLTHIFFKYIYSPITTFFRFIHLLILFTPLLLTFPIIYLGPLRQYGTTGPDKLSSNKTFARAGARLWFQYVAWTMELAGASFIKLGQWAASRTDIFPEVLTEELSKMHSNAKPHSFNVTKRVVEKAFKRKKKDGGKELKLEDIFLDFEKKPIGVGAIAQVYKARLNPEAMQYFNSSHHHSSSSSSSSSSKTYSNPSSESRYVAIKVLHPHVASIVERDISIMMFFAKIINALPTMEWLSLPGEVDTFANMMRQQMDLRVEANNLVVFRKNFGIEDEVGGEEREEIPEEGEGKSKKGFFGFKSKKSKTTFPDVVFPKPYLSLSSRQVLVEDYISAIPMTEFLKNASGDGSNKMERLVSSKGLDVFLKMLLLDNFVHADLHPGNISVRFYKKEWAHSPASGLGGKKTEKVDVEAFDDTSNTHYTIGDVDVKIPHKLSFSHSKTSSDTSFSDYGTDPRVESVTQHMHSLSGHKSEWQAYLQHLTDQGFQPQLCFIDVGLVTELSETNRRNFLDLFTAIAAFDGYKVGELMIERSRTPETAIDADVFALKTQRLVDNIKQRTFALGNVKVGDLLATMLGMVRGHHVRMESDFVTVVLSILLLEGIGRQLDPNMDLFKSSLPILRQLGASEKKGHGLSALKLDKDTLSMIKVWLALETRQFITASIQDIHNCVKYDLLSPNR